jgi:hypothetical protein
VTDRLDLANAFEAAGFERKAAEHVAGEIFDAIRENVATKADLAELKSEILKWMFAQTVVTIGGLAALFRLLH